jgi:tetratricopeptide (TPR) repeat protein
MRRLVLLSALLLVAMTSAAPRALAQETDRILCFSLGNENYKDKDKYDAGESACTRMIDTRKFSGKGLASIHRARGSWRQKKGQLDASLADYAIAIQIEPKNVESFDYRADVYQQKGDFDRALADYDRASKLDPLYAAAHFSRGMIYEKKKDLDKARAEYNIAIALPTKDRIAQWAQDNARARLKALDEAKEETKK